MVDSCVDNELSSNHKLSDNWTLWAHLPHDTDWTVNSYKCIMQINSVESTIAVTNSLPEKLVKNCMLFLMRDGIHPTWEDPKNRNGGCFSFKVANKLIFTAWKNLSYTLVGETLTTDKKYKSYINGITISPKKNFCIIKVWVSSCLTQNPSILNEVEGLSFHGCLFKKHNPEY